MRNGAPAGPRFHPLKVQVIETQCFISGAKALAPCNLYANPEVFQGSDIKADPYEMKNLIKEPSAQPALEEMKAELKKLLRSTGGT
jgi:hypothetical protein